ncbi:hypothetical protein KIW84_023544 [Lathyrus oleraceus]|uniref:Cytochrome b/b6 N-terminal region profile domain-containing protein n=1 Tax=Pisum sativum TaxID=3888 RepID=A0A9D4YEG3_PEA|nr:hypothetical protein KIW84_023544 [Pisum sativum]
MIVLMMILHVFRVYLTGGFKKPHELTWVTGVVLGVLTASFGVSGYSLPWNQIGYWAVKIVTGVSDAIPEKLIMNPLIAAASVIAAGLAVELAWSWSTHSYRASCRGDCKTTGSRG